MPQTRSLNASKSSFLASTSRQISSVFCMSGLLVSEATHQMVVHHAGRLHEGVAYGGADETEASLCKGLAHAIGQLRLRRDLLAGRPLVHQGLAIDERPQIGVQAAVLLDDIQGGARVVTCRPDLEAIADDSRRSQQLLQRCVPHGS